MAKKWPVRPLCVRHCIPIMPSKLRNGHRRTGCWRCTYRTPARKKYAGSKKDRARHKRYEDSKKGKMRMRRQYRTPQKRERQKWWALSKYKRLKIEENKI